MSLSCVCGSNSILEYPMSCPKEGFHSISHNEPGGLTANLLTEVRHDMCVEPDLQSLTREQLVNVTASAQHGARLDIAGSGGWGGHYEKTYFDVRIFNPLVPTHRHTQDGARHRHDQLSQCHRKHEHVKNREYEQRVREV